MFLLGLIVAKACNKSSDIGAGSRKLATRELCFELPGFQGRKIHVATVGVEDEGKVDNEGGIEVEVEERHGKRF